MGQARPVNGTECRQSHPFWVHYVTGYVSKREHDRLKRWCRFNPTVQDLERGLLREAGLMGSFIDLFPLR